MSGHVFVVHGDMTQLACDAWLLPTDEDFSVTASWREVVATDGGILKEQEPWRNGERVRRLGPRGSRGPEIWLGRIGTKGEPAQWYADGVRSFVELAGREFANEPTRTRPPLLAVNHVGTGEGGARASKGEVLRALFDTLHHTVSTLDVDVVVVSWDERSHAAAQRSRMLSLAGSDEEPLKRAIDQWVFTDDERTVHLHGAASRLAEHALLGNLAVFMGAGVSAGAGLPSWSTLLAEIGSEADPPVTALELAALPDPRDQAALIARRLGGEQRLIARVIDRLRKQHHSLQHALLSSLPVREFTTTNFDELFELAAQTNGRALKVLPRRDGSSDADTDRWLLKLHGTTSQPDHIVLTRSAYLDAPRQRGALFGLVQAMLLTRHMLFVGYGLKDETFHDLVHEVRYARTGANESLLGTTVALFDDPVQSEIWQGDVNVVAVRPAQLNPSEREVAIAARDVERFLDLVGLIAADRWGFLLDPDYRGMLTPDQRELQRLLSTVADRVDLNETNDGWRQVADLLVRFGAQRSTGSPDVRSGNRFGLRPELAGKRVGDLVPGLEDRTDDPARVFLPMLTRRLLPSNATWADVASLRIEQIFDSPKMTERSVDLLLRRLRQPPAKPAVEPPSPEQRPLDAVALAEQVITSFDDRERVILPRLLNVSGTPRTLADIGDELELTRERIRQIERHMAQRLEGLSESEETEELSRRASEIRAAVGALSPLRDVPEEIRPNPDSLADELIAYLAGPYRIEGQWLRLREYRTTGEVLDRAFNSSHTGEVVSREALRDALDAIEVNPDLLDELVTMSDNYRFVDDMVVAWPGTQAERAARILTVRGAPMEIEELVSIVNPDNERSFANALAASDALRRVGLKRWALTSWEMSVYEGIVPAMVERLTQGSCDLEMLASDLQQNYGVSPDSVRLNAQFSPMFVVEEGQVRLRREDEPYVPSGTLEETDRCERVGSAWALRVPIDTDLLRGSGRTVPEAFATHVGLQPLGEFVAQSMFGPIRFTWRIQPNVSSLRRVAERLGGSRGDDLLIVAESPGWLTFRVDRATRTPGDTPEE